jgi:Protein of unknown function (DUF2794)
MSETASEESPPGIHGAVAPFPDRKPPPVVAFDRHELQAIMNVYGRMVAAGEWRDYAMDFMRDQAVFSIFRRSSEMPLYRVLKIPELRLKQGQYQVVAPGGLILKRGSDLKQVLRVLDKPLALVMA